MAPRTSHFELEKIEGALEDYAEGAIVYMYVENFVTYDACKVYPGPWMNMLLGPNGSGKSSIVAAMALGLGWHPAVLGRSRDALEFIKYGRERAVIEMALRLADPVGLLEREGLFSEEEGAKIEWRKDGILMIRRELARNSRGHSSSEWFVNGRSGAARLIATLMKALNVQVDNLCQFLPQDKVSEFARLTPSELLMETEKAAAGRTVTHQHRQLVELCKQKKEMTMRSEEQSRKLANLLQQNENVEGLIHRIKEREQYLRRIKLCERKRPWLLYNSARDTFMEAKAERDKARSLVEKAESESQPIKNQLRASQVNLSKIEKKRSTTIIQADNHKKKLEALFQVELPRLNREITTHRTQILKLREAQAKRETTIAELKRTICHLEDELCQDEIKLGPGIIANSDPFRSELNETNRKQSEIENEMTEVDDQIRRISREGERVTREIDQCGAELRQLDDVRLQRLEAVKRANPDTFTAYTWINSHSDAFREPVYGPICLELNVKQGALSRHVESVIPRGQLLNFVVTNFADYEVFMNCICEQQGLRANVTVMEDIDISQAKNVMDRSELQRLGFVGTVLDVVEAPGPVLAALVDTAKIHLVPVALGSVDNERIESLCHLQKYAVADGTYELRRSHYSEEVAVRVMPLKRSIFLGESVRSDRRVELTSRIEERRAELARNQERMKKLYQQQETLRQKIGVLRTERDRINESRRVRLAAAAEIRKKRGLLELKKGNLEKLLSPGLEDGEKAEELSLRGALKEIFHEHSRVNIEATKIMEEYCKLVMEMGVENLSIVQIESEVIRLEEAVRGIEMEHEVLRRALADAEATLTEAKRVAKEFLEQASREELDEETKEAFAELPETLEELDRVMAVERARTELGESATLGATTIKEYEQRQELIIKLEESLNRIKNEQKELQEKMESLHSLWFPAVEAMISLIDQRFSAFFASMGCAGQVRLAPRGNDYEDWALEILVKFRDEEPLKVLSAQRQSGGEKSVSTILFLLALQEQAKSPFRVVDEINQGMDSTNERRVHALIVETATRAAHSQYFLITPKLLTGLTYHENMHVLCVFNGEGVPPLVEG